MQLRLIQSDKPNKNTYIESFNGWLRDECLNEHWFPSLLHARTAFAESADADQLLDEEKLPGFSALSVGLCTTARTGRW